MASARIKADSHHRIKLCAYAYSWLFLSSILTHKAFLMIGEMANHQKVNLTKSQFIERQVSYSQYKK
jgi:hypothetical protein